MSIKIIQWNLNGFYSQLEYLQSLIDKKQPKIICLQETNFKGLSSGKLKNYKAFIKNRSTDHAVVKQLSISRTPSTAKRLRLHTTLKLWLQELYYLQTYISTCLTANILMKLNRIFNQLLKPFITGEFNSHNI